MPHLIKLVKIDSHSDVNVAILRSVTPWHALNMSFDQPLLSFTRGCVN
jgi:hypothetical protein